MTTTTTTMRIKHGKSSHRKKWSIVSLAIFAVAVISILGSVIFAFFSDNTDADFYLQSGFLCVDSQLEIDGQVGDILDAIASRAICNNEPLEPFHWKQISTGSNHTCAIASDNKAYCWGSNNNGQIGDNTSGTNRLIPTAVDTTGALSGKTILSISVGDSYTCAIASDNKAYCWGLNSDGELGDNSTIRKLIPTAVDTTGALSGKTILSISAGDIHTCAIASDNKAYCWGGNNNGQIGDNTSSANKLVPTAVDTTGALSGKTILSISAGVYHTCAIASDNKAYCWGDNSNGRLGDNSTTQSLIPVAVYTTGALSGKTILSISAGNNHTCAIASDNQAYCWGGNTYSQIGDNTSGTNRLAPTAVYIGGILTDKTVLSISASSVHTCAIASNNQAYCWGWNSTGQIGDNTTSGVKSAPTTVDTSSFADSNCDNLPCNGEYQGATGAMIQPNTIHEFSYTLTNVGTTDYQNYTGDQIAAWLEDYSPFPEPYAPVEYLQFSGTQYINLGVDQNGSIALNLDYQLTNVSVSSWLFGSRPNPSNGGIYILNLANSSFYGTYNSAAIITQNLADTNRHIIGFKFNTTPVWTFDGVTQMTPMSTVLNESPRNLFLGALNSNNTDVFGMTGKIYSFQMTKSNAADNRDMIPVVNTQTGECGMWDNVTEQFFGNSGTGTITCPAPITANSLRVLLYPTSVSNATINAEVAAMQTGATTSPSAIANLNGSCLRADTFYGTDDGIESCLTSVLSGTLNDSYAVGQSKTRTYKFVLYAPIGRLPGAIIYFGLSSSAQGAPALNWRQQLHPYISATTPTDKMPTIRDAHKNRQPFVDQVTNATSYLESLVTASGAKDGACAFSGAACTISVTSNGGFNPSAVGKYNVSYEVIDSDSNIATLTLIVEVWNFVKIYNGQYHVLAMGTNGSVWTFGKNANGQRGIGTSGSSATARAPTQVARSYFNNLPVIDVTAAYDTSCALNSAGNAYCWGDGSTGGLGNGTTTTTQTTPVPVTMPSGITFTSIAGCRGCDTASTMAAIGSDGNVYVWGYGANYRLGTGSTSNSLVPTKITTSGDFTQVSQGLNGGIAINTAGRVYVWGRNLNGQFAQGSTSTTDAITSLPTLVSNPNVADIVQVSYGGYTNRGHIITLNGSGNVWAWGYNANGQFGDGSTTQRTSPVAITSVSNVRQINTWSDGTHYVIGNNVWSTGYMDANEGLLGSTATRTSPVMSTVLNVQNNVGMVTAGFNNAWILTPDGKMVYGTGDCDSARQTFGSTSVQSSTHTSVVPWSFTPPSL
ncbi:MAG: hypothetical protein LBQ11_00600 [Candidatus Nomurabacteria bacterium]|jgi:alpha-tubulin suppressor-like RCC1 family protein|nr:hypothetical protein [Candidatus Nomurabacteria bacterium]